MSRRLVWGGFALTAVVLAAPEPIPRPAQKFAPRLEPMAETKLLMEGIHQANYRGLDRLLQEKPADDETWRFARGQALLIAEGSNLLMMRPPRNAGEEDWMRLATELRNTAGVLARGAEAKDYARSRAGLGELTNACNRCHQKFRVPTKVGPARRPSRRRRTRSSRL